MDKVIECQNVRLGYGGKAIFASLDLVINKGDFLGVIGPNGSGKTTFIKSVLGLLEPKAGKILRNNIKQFGYSMQRQAIDKVFPFSVFEIVMMARAVFGENKDKVYEALETVEMDKFASTAFLDLSGGQKQKVLLARALCLEPDFLVLDEPTADLDIRAEREILELIKNLQEEKKLTVVLVTHKVNEIINYAKTFMFLDGAGSFCLVPKDELNAKILSDIFGMPVYLKEEEGKLLLF